MKRERPDICQLARPETLRLSNFHALNNEEDFIMQQGSQVSGNIAPTIKGAEKDTKEVIVLGGVILFLGGLLAAAWLYSQSSDQMKTPLTTDKFQNAGLSEILKQSTTLNQAGASISRSSQVSVPAVSMPDIIHADIYFEVGRKGLTEEAKAQLSAQAALLKQHDDYGVLIQGYTDQQGSASYNKLLGMKRAETVKAELMNAGIAEHRIKTVSLGEEGALCVDGSDACRHMNRRVHLEVRKIGQEHMTLPPVPATTSETPDSSIDLPSVMDAGDGGPSTPPNPITTLEPASGS
jgi:peptidoglycan-associated lipoprotein